MDKVSRVISGTWGEVWLDGEYVGECYGAQAKLAYNRESIQQCRKLMPGKKLMSVEGTGSLKLYKVNSRMIRAVALKVKDGKDPRFTIISKLDDPDAYGAERMSISGVAFDDTTLADWEVGNIGKTENPFTFEDFELLDAIEEG
ncbi:MAG TPA: phage tail tube protein [Clostridia bacterium]|nr:phage tail tube protein [Clostridia bacterium]